MPQTVSSIAWDFPAPFSQKLAPEPADIDGLRHVNNAVYVRWCEQVAWAHSASLGLDIAAYQRLNRAVAIRHSDYDYLQPAHLGDALVLGTWLTASDGKLNLERRFQLARLSDGTTLMRGRWQVVCIELDSGRPRRMPPEFSVYNDAVIKAGT